MFSKSVFTILILMMIGTCHSKRDYSVKLTRFEGNPNTDPDFCDKGTLRVTRKARNLYVMSGSWKLYKNAGNECLAILTIYQITFSENKVLEYTKQGKLCDFLANEKMLYPSLVEQSNLPSPDTCPFPKGNYTIKDYQIDEDRLPKELPPGKFTGSALIKLEQKTVFGFDFDFSVEVA